MLSTVAEALGALRTAVLGLLSPPADAALAPEVFVAAARSHPAGIGGFIGVHPTPRAERHARRVAAEVVVRVRAATPAGLLAAEVQATSDLIGADAALLRQRGVLRLQRRPGEVERSLTAADGLGAPAGRELRFDALFEHAPVPVTGEGLLASVPQDVTSAALTGSGRLLYETEFETDPMGDFRQEDGAGTGGPGVWVWDAAERVLRQTSSLAGGSNTATANKQGTCLLLREAVTGGPLADFLLRAEVRMEGDGGIGLVFRFRDVQNHGFFLAEQPGGWRLFGRRDAGAATLFQTGATDLTRGFAPGEWLRLRLLAQGPRFELSINERVAMAGTESRLALPGTVGIICRRAPTARIRHLRLESL